MNAAVRQRSSGVYDPRSYTDFYGRPIQIYVNYTATVLGTTTASTVCPNGQPGAAC